MAPRLFMLMASWLSCACTVALGSTDSVYAHLPHLDHNEPIGPLGRLSCLEMFVRQSQASSGGCQQLPAPENWCGPNISAEICQLPGNSIMVNIYTPSQLATLFHAHVQGPQIVLPPVTTCSIVQHSFNKTHPNQEGSIQMVHRAYVQDLMPGSYLVTLRAIAHNFTFTKNRLMPVGCKSHLWRAHFTVNGDANSTYSKDSIAKWPTCNATYLEGTVLSKLDSTSRLNRRHGEQASAWRALLLWQPKGCNLIPVEKNNVTGCLKDRLVCFIGDSQLRYLQNGLIDVADAQQAGGFDYYRMEHSKPKSIAAHTNVRFKMNQYLDPAYLSVPGVLENCTEVVLGMGCWPLSGHQQPRWTSGRYVHRLTQVFKLLKQKLPTKPLYWVTYNYHWQPSNDSSMYPPYTEVYNSVGIQLARLHGLHVINTWDITGPLFESAHDGTHHHNSGAAGYFMNRYLTNVLCIQRYTA